MTANGNGGNLALGYIRVSTDEQARAGVSLDVQREKITQYCTLRDLDLLTILEDGGYTATDTRRPAMQLLIEATRGRKIGHIVVFKLDRLFRNLRDSVNCMEDWRERGITLHSVSEGFDLSTPMGECIFGILNTFAQFESKTIGLRVKACMRAKQKNGFRVTRVDRVPFGYRAGAIDPATPTVRPLVPILEEQAALARMLALAETGMTPGKIAKQLTCEGCPPRGPRWHPQTVRRILKREQRNPMALVRKETQ